MLAPTSVRGEGINFIFVCEILVRRGGSTWPVRCLPEFTIYGV
jgi:hypothetical protein